jgi:type I restriction enzyme S subunit
MSKTKGGETISPKGWCWVSLRDILEGIEAGKSFKCHTRPARDDEWGVIKVSAMTWGEFDERENKAIPADKNIDPRNEIRCGDVLLSRSNTVELVGASVLVGHCRPKLLLSDKSMRLLVSDSIEQAWLQKVLTSSIARRQLSAVATGSSNSMRNVSQEKVLNVRVLLPPYNEQQRIVAKIEELFSDLDAGVAALERAKAKLKRYRAAVLKAAVEGRLTEQWRAENPAQEPASKLLERILKERRKKWEHDQLAAYKAKDKQPPKNWQEKYKEPAGPDTANLPNLPEGWCWATVEQLGNVQLGRQRSPKNRSKDYPTPYIRAANLTEAGLSLTDVLDMEFKPNEVETYQLSKRDIIVSEASGSPDQVGKPALWNDELPVCCFQNTVIRLRPHRTTSSEFLLTVFQHCYFNKIFAKIAAGVGINHLSAAKFARIAIPLAPEAEQSEVVAEVERRLSILVQSESLLTTNLRRAARLRQSILKRAFEGKLVPQDPNDEPASVLLERIRNSTGDSDTIKGTRKSPGNSRRRAAATKETEISQ